MFADTAIEIFRVAQASGLFNAASRRIGRVDVEKSFFFQSSNVIGLQMREREWFDVINIIETPYGFGRDARNGRPEACATLN
jgi:hypothetical protein